MIKTNYHTHSNYCHGEGNMELYVQAAIKTGLSVIGFSSHAPVSFKSDWHMKESEKQNYIKEISYLKRKYREKINIYSGFETDFIPNVVTPSEFRNDVDFLIGSVHYVGQFEDGKNHCIDNTIEEFENGLKTIFNNDIQNLVGTYYENIIQMVKNYPPDIVGHLDLIKKLNTGNRYFNENDMWYVKLLKKVISVIAKSSCVVEINTRGFYKGMTKEFYPSKWIVKECLANNIPVTISTDAHHPDEINREFKKAVSMLLNVGYKNIKIFNKGEWTETPLELI